MILERFDGVPQNGDLMMASNPAKFVCNATQTSGTISLTKTTQVSKTLYKREKYPNLPLRAILLACLLALFVPRPVLAGGSVKYPVADIADSLKKGVNAVIRKNIMEFRIVEKNRWILHVVRAVTILNSSANDYAQKQIDYDRFSKVAVFNGTVYDEEGDVIRKLKKSEVYDQAAYDGLTLFSDNRIKVVDLSQRTYPYTVEFEYEIEESKLFFLPIFYPLSSEDATLEFGRCTASYPIALRPRYKEVNIFAKPVSQKQGEMETITWTFKGLHPIKSEPFGPSTIRQLPHVLFGPSIFDFDGHEGNMSSWEQYGQWQYFLNKGRDELPPATEEKVKQLIPAHLDTEEKVRILYDYLQGKTRYVGIQEGIGGLQPFPAATVDEMGYGDCKALSNYMIALLKAVDLKGYYTKVRAGENEPDIDVDFPSQQTNHVIVAVPNKSDTIWLECTSQTKPFGYMGSFTGDREAFMITDQGAKIVRTPRYGERDNVQSRKARIVVDKAGNSKANVTTVYQGLLYEKDGLDIILSDQFDEQRKWIQENTDIPAFDIVNFKMKAIKTKVPKAIVETELSINRLATVSGKRLLFAPNFMNKASYLPPKVENRKSDVVRKLAYVMNDTIDFEIPADIYPEFLPEPVKINSRFGEYEMRIVMNEKGIRYIRRLKMNKGTFPPESYQEFVDFYKNISKADNTKLVFLNKT